MHTGDNMTTLVQVMEKMRLKKIDNEFKLEGNAFTIGRGKKYAPDQLKIIRTFRFEGDSNPDDSSILYIIEANDGAIGYSLDTYGTYSSHDDDDGDYDNFIRQIPVEDRDDQLSFEL